VDTAVPVLSPAVVVQGEDPLFGRQEKEMKRTKKNKRLSLLSTPLHILKRWTDLQLTLWHFPPRLCF
jgi:hypothetical protein